MARKQGKSSSLETPVYVDPNLSVPTAEDKARAKEAARLALERLKHLASTPLELWDTLGEPPLEEPSPKPTTAAGELPVEVAAEVAVEVAFEVPAEEAAVEAAVEAAEVPSEEAAEEEAEVPAEVPSEEAAEEDAEVPAEEDAVEAPEEPLTEPNTPKPKAAGRWRVPVATIASIALLCAAIYGIFVWDRWYRFDDERDIEGLWYVMGTSVPIEIGSGFIYFDDKTSYKYTVDPAAKTISFKLGNLDGTGHYWFRDDRQVLVIADGKGFTQEETANSDLLRLLNHFSDLSQGKVVPVPQGDGIIALSRDPNDRAGEMIYQSEDSSSSKSAPLPYDAVVDTTRG